MIALEAHAAWYIRPESTVDTNVYVIIEPCSTFGNTSINRWTKPLHEVDDRLIILLAGGMKKRQPEDIRRAKANWEDYRNRKT